MTQQSSYRTILRSSSIIGGAQVINILASLLKMKVAAVLLGPMGVGLVGLYTNVIQTAAAVASLGISNAGTRQIAAANAEGGDEAVGRSRRALFWGTLGLSLIGAMLFWLASGFIARTVLDDPARSGDVAWLSLGVALTVASGAQGALLTGLRRIGDLARIQLGTGLGGTVLGVLALWIWGENGLLAMVLLAPILSFMFGHLYVSRLGPPVGRPSGILQMGQEWGEMLRVGVPFMLSSLITLAGFLAVRGIVQHQLGGVALGHFQAAWAIGATYLGFVLGAMGTDYYPRLTAAINDPATATRLVNEQTEVALLLCAPVLLAMLGLAPWVISLLYTADFGPAVEILRWQILGDILKVMSWPLGFVLIAKGAGKTFIVTETTAIAVYVLGVFLAQYLIGVTATGIAFLLMYIAYLPLVWWLGGRMIRFRWSRAVRAQGVALGAMAIMVEVSARLSDPLGAAMGLGLALVMGIWAYVRMTRLVGVNGKTPFFSCLTAKLKKKTEYGGGT